MPPDIVIPVAMFVCLLVGLFMGHPVSFVLGGLAVIFGGCFWGPSCFPLFMSRIYGLMNNFILVAIPLFILMANFLERSGIADGLFESLQYLLGSLKGGVAIAVVVVCTLFAACTGIIGASVVTMGLLALPAMLRRGYQKELSVGTIAAAGSLGTLIPPSITLIIIGDQATLSVGKVFAGGIVPGLVLSGLYVVYIVVTCNMRPAFCPPMPAEIRALVPLKKKLMGAAMYLVPPLVLIFGVLGVILTGVATPTEAAAVGAFLALLMTIAYRRFTWERLKEAIYSTAKTNCMVIMLLVGATCFTGVFVGTGGGTAMASLVLGIGGGKWGAFVVMMLIIAILGMFIDPIAIIMFSFPLFLPIVAELGFDKLWFVIMVAINLQLSYVTPPFGYALFYIKGIAPEDVKLIDIYHGIIPFIPLMIIGLVICAINPQLCTWLPSFIK